MTTSMSTTRTVGRGLVAGGVTLVVATLLAGVVGALLRLSMWGAMSPAGHHASGWAGPMGPGAMGGSTAGFQMGFGLPVATVLLLAVPLALLVGAGYVLYRLAVDAGAGRGVEPRDPALVELRRAYARGELTDEEFERRERRLTG